MEKKLIPFYESLCSNESKLSSSASDEKKLGILAAAPDEMAKRLNEGFASESRLYQVQLTKVFEFPFDASRLCLLLNFLKQYNSDRIKLLKLPHNSDFFLAEPVSAHFCFFADRTRIFVEIKCFEEVSSTAAKALKVIFNDFSANCAVEPSVSPKANSCLEAGKALICSMHERPVVKVACKQFLLLDFDLEESPDAPLVFRDNHGCIPSLEWFLSSQTKNGSYPLGTNTKGDLHEKLFENDTWQNMSKFSKWKLFELSRLHQDDDLLLRRENADLTDEATEVTVLQRKLAKNQEELQETRLQLGQLSVEHEKMVRENRKEIAQQSCISKTSVGTQVALSQSEPVTAATSSAQGDDACAISRVAERQPPNNSVQETVNETSAGKCVSLGYVPSTVVERSIYNKYKLLLLTIEGALLSDDVTKLKEWASNTLSVNVSLSVSEIFLEMDQKGVISSSNLNLLRDFFEKIIRIDLVYLIDCFLRGEYGHLQQTNGSVKKINASINTRPRATPIRSASDACLTPSPASGYNVNPPSAYAKMSSTVSQTKLQGTLTNSNLPGVQRKTQGFQKVHENVVRNGMVTDGYEGNGNDANNEAENCTSMANSNARKVVLTCSNHPSSPVNHGRGPLFDMGSNGKKLSKFLRPNSAHDRRSSPQDCESDDDDESQWLCNHYKRRCHVKFDCCNKYWPCHRCHNSKSNCGQNKLKSRDTKFIKCVKCGTEQQFNEGSQFCIQCKTKLAKYFCFICKHLTGTDDHPYHCDKCGICRIHGDRSFHCDVCGVCLDVQLRGNHKCRAGSAHDECCICLEDAFTGCQILPCSHKVHKECATKMIRSGITRCPICRESFAHKLERRPQPTKKLTRKK